MKGRFSVKYSLKCGHASQGCPLLHKIPEMPFAFITGNFEKIQTRISIKWKEPRVL